MSHIISSFTHVIAQRYPALFRHRWIAVVSVISALSVLQRIYSTLRVPKQLRHLPKVSTFGWFLSVFRGDPADIRLTQWVMPTVEQHGICLKYYLGRWTVTVGDPLLLQAMLKNVNAFPKEDKARLDPDLLLTNRESNMGNANYDVWKRQRRVANPAFHRAMPVHVFGEITLRMFQAIDKQHSDGVIDAADYMRRYALDCLGIGVFDFDMHAVTDRASPYATLYKEAFSIVRDPLVYLFPAYTRIPSRWIPYRYRARQANERLRQILYKIIEDRKQAITDNTNNDQSKKDLLTMMIEASVTQFSPDSDSLGSSHAFLTDGELVSNLAVFFVAGHETTASATASMIYYLASHPEIQERARMEVLSILGDDDQDVAPTEEQLRQMPFLNNCIKETMRINPPTSGNLPRIAAQDTRIGDFFIPKGTPISLELYCVHHLAKYWHEPQVFNPDRFDPTHASYMKDAIWMPFGYGPRTCIGSNFSLFEQRVLHAMLLKRYTWSLVPNSEHANGLQNQRGGGIGLLGPETLHIQLTRRY